MKIYCSIFYKFCIGDATYVLHFSKQNGLTCTNDNDNAIGKSVNGQPLEKCEDRCSKNKVCHFYFHNGWCVLYRACDQTRSPQLKGVTYKKLDITGLRFRFFKIKVILLKYLL